MKVGLWSQTPGSNNATPPDGWPEGQAPSTVNDCAREMMAAIRTYLADAQYFDPGITPSFLSATSFSLNTADVTTFHVGRRVKMADGAFFKYGTINSVSATFVQVRLDPNTPDLTASLSSVAVGVVANNFTSMPPAPNYRRNVIINSCMDVWQRGNGPFVPANNTKTYTADRFAWLHSASTSVNITRAERSAAAANVPTIAQAGQFIASSLRISVSAVDSALATTDFGNLLYYVEGYDWRQIAHQPNVLSFWANTNRSGIYCVSLRNTGANQSFVQNYTISAVNTWSRFAVTVPEAPTAGTWDYSAGQGLIVSWNFGAGTSFQGGAGNWTAANLLATSSQTNFMASAGNVFMITGIQLEQGNMATDLEFKHYTDEIERCQRYYWRGLPATGYNMATYTANTVFSFPVAFTVPMRTTPTVATVTPGITLTNMVSTPTVSLATPNGARLLCNGSLASVNTNFTYSLGDYFEADAEL
jgi:hypothetical protein